MLQWEPLRWFSAHAGTNSSRVGRKCWWEACIFFSRKWVIQLLFWVLMFPSHCSKGQIKVTCWLVLTFLVFLMWVLLYWVFWDSTRHYPRAILLYQQFPAFLYLIEKEDAVVSWWCKWQCSGWIASGASLRQVRAPQVILSLFPPTTALTCWGGYSQHAQKEWCVWFDFSQCLLSGPHLHYRIPICTSLVPIPLFGPLALQGCIKVYSISCCLMPSTAALFLTTKTPSELFLGFSVQVEINPCRALLTVGASFAAGAISTALISLLWFFFSPRLFANSVEFVTENHKL